MTSAKDGEVGEVKVGCGESKRGKTTSGRCLGEPSSINAEEVIVACEL